MTRTEQIREWLAAALFENLWLKAISLVCALGFFVFIRGAERAERRFDVGVAHTVPPESANRVLVKEPPSEISVTLSGPRTQLEALPRDLGTLNLDLSTGFESVIELTPAMIPNLPPGISVEQIFPTRFEVRWDDVVSRDIPVQIARTGEPAPGHAVLGSISTTPQTVTATGPRSVVDLMQLARAAAFDVSGLTEGYHTRSLALELPPSGVSYSVPNLSATIQVAREERVVPFKGIRVEVVGHPKSTTRPATVTVKVRGAPEVVDAIEADAIVPRVELPADVDTTKPGSRVVKVFVDVPSADAVVEPQEVLVKW